MTQPHMHTTEEIVSLLRSRAHVGLKKYGVTLDRTDLGEADWLQHMIEELLDGAGYALAAKRRALETATAVHAAIAMLEAGDHESALAILKDSLPQPNPLPQDFGLGDVELHDVLPVVTYLDAPDFDRDETVSEVIERVQDGGGA